MMLPIFVLLPGIGGKHLVRLDRIVHVILSDSIGTRKSDIVIEGEDKEFFSLYSSATVDEINEIIQLELSKWKSYE